jgi:FG-GAP-like repeat
MAMLHTKNRLCGSLFSGASLVLLGVCCSPSAPPYLVPGLDQMQETGEGAVSEPVLRTTLPASWDENWFSSPAVFDLNNDGTNEIIASRHSVLYVWKSDGTLLWRAPVGENASSANDHGSSRMYCSPVVGDLNNDGYGEIAVCYDNQAAVYDHAGNLMPGWPQAFPGSTDEIRSIAASDINGDGVCEIVVVKTSNGPVTMVWSLSGVPLAGWPQIADRTDAQKNDFGGYNQNIGIADVNGDGKKEIVCTYDICHIGIFFPDGTSYPANAMFSGKYACSVPMFHDISLAIQGWGSNGNDRDEFTDTPPVFADMDNDGLPEIVLFADHERAGEYINRGNSLWALNPDMTRVPGFETPKTTGMPLYTGYQDNIVQVAPAPCVSNLGGASPHIIVPSYDGWMRCYSSSGAEEWKVQFDATGSPFIGAGEAVAGDLDNDGVPEIVFTTYSIEPDRSFLIILNSEGHLLHRIKMSGRGSMAAPTLADVDNDGVLEIIVSLKDALGSGLGGVQIWDVASAKKNTLDWPTGRGNYLRTGAHL